jgi:hypothetical protein
MVMEPNFGISEAWAATVNENMAGLDGEDARLLWEAYGPQ